MQTLITYNDAPEPWSLFFQDNITPQIEGLEELHNDIMFYLAIILFVVSWIMLNLILNYRKSKVDYISRTSAEFIWITIWSLIWICLIYCLLLSYIIVQKYLELLSEADWTKLFMNNSGSNSNTGIFTNTTPQVSNPSVNPPAVPVFIPVTEHYRHGINSLTVVIIEGLNREGQAANFFFLDDITRKSCTITFIKPIPNIYATDADSLEQVRLLKKLVTYFPNGYHFNYGTKTSMLDAYRLQGLVAKVVEESNNEFDWPYKSDQRKPEDMFPYYDSNRPKGYYQPWASDIADSLSKYRKDVNGSSDNRVTLDSYSAIFLATFRNANPRLSPTATWGGGPIVLALREL